jgi:hypothetical protein
VTQTLNSSSNLRLVGACLLLVHVAGCSSGTDPGAAVAKANSTNVKRLANLYMTFQSQHDWAGPKDETEFKDFIRSIDATKLQRINVDPAAIDAIFSSERDGKPFKIRYGVRGSSMGSSEPVIFEAVGVAGKRQIGRLNMTQLEADNAEYDALWSGKAKPEAPVREN